jgi:phosphatidylserine/phosphatidylglycerophosphate/cardiolipin synthase-like enzyme
MWMQACLLLVAQQAPAASIELVESWPSGTTLDQAELPDAWQVWIEMIDGARRTVNLGHFYAVDEGSSRLTKVIEALERAGKRGVKLRFLVEKNFRGASEATLERLSKIEGLELRRLDSKAVYGAGIMHAKYMLVDGEQCFLGSQNFDWRSLEHIQELGVRVRSASFCAPIERLFEADWARALDQTAPLPPNAEPVEPQTALFRGENVRIQPLASPEERVGSAQWDLPRIREAIRSAKRSVDVQVMTYRMTDRSKRYFEELEGELKAAAARGVEVRLLVADWCKRKGTIEGLQAIEPLEHLAVRMVTIPVAERGFIPYARVIHAKYMVVDGETAWLGTSNWERDYFYESRNCGVFVEGRSFGGELQRFFDRGWSSPYAAPVDPKAAYEAPRIGD